MDPAKNREKNAVVIPAANVASSVACLRSLGKRGIKTIAVSSEATPTGFQSKYCDETVSVPAPNKSLSAYGDALLELARRDDVRTILPVRDVDVYALARNRTALAEHVGTPWPSLDTLRGAQDRVELFAAAEAAGVGMPKTRLLNEWDDWDEATIVKPRFTVNAVEYAEEIVVGTETAVGKEGESSGEEPEAVVADGGDESTPQHRSTEYVEPNEEPDEARLVAEMGHVPLAQEYVPGDEYGFFALYDHGEAVATFQHRQRRGWKYCGGPSAYRESVDIPDLDSAGRALLDELDWHGVAMVEFLRDEETGEFELMEVNPRFWSSLPFTVQAGVDFPYLYWQQATGQRMSTPSYEVGVAGHLLRGELLHLYSILAEDYPLVERPSFARSLLSVGGSLARHRRFDYLSADDPGPFVQDVRNTVGAARGLVGAPRSKTWRGVPTPAAILKNLRAR